METAITTTARKIQRHLNTNPMVEEMFFDAEGNVVATRETIPNGAIDLREHVTTPHLLMLPSTHRYTQRYVQDVIDAHTTAGDWIENLANIEMARA